MAENRAPAQCVRPECQHPNARVLETWVMPCGRRVRRRLCRQCGHRWWTEQAPEEELESWRLVWTKRGIIDLLPRPESSKKGKV